MTSQCKPCSCEVHRDCKCIVLELAYICPVVLFCYYCSVYTVHNVEHVIYCIVSCLFYEHGSTITVELPACHL